MKKKSHSLSQPATPNNAVGAGGLESKSDTLPPVYYPSEDSLPAEIKNKIKSPPIDGKSLQRAAEFICPAYGLKIDVRNLHGLAEDDLIAIVKPSRRHHCSIFFMDLVKYEQAIKNRNVLDEKKKQGSGNKQSQQAVDLAPATQQVIAEAPANGSTRIVT